MVSEAKWCPLSHTRSPSSHNPSCTITALGVPRTHSGEYDYHVSYDAYVLRMEWTKIMEFVVKVARVCDASIGCPSYR